MGRPDDFHYEYDSDKYNEESFKVKKALSSLGLKDSFSKEEIKKAYHNLAKKFHPDVSGNQEDFKKFSLLQLTYFPFNSSLSEYAKA